MKLLSHLFSRYKFYWSLLTGKETGDEQGQLSVSSELNRVVAGYIVVMFTDSKVFIFHKFYLVGSLVISWFHWFQIEENSVFLTLALKCLLWFSLVNMFLQFEANVILWQPMLLFTTFNTSINLHVRDLVWKMNIFHSRPC